MGGCSSRFQPCKQQQGLDRADLPVVIEADPVPTRNLEFAGTTTGSVMLLANALCHV